jgi:heptaprenyl diphosphate synthase
MNNFWNNYPLIKKDLENVEAILLQNMKSREKKIEESLFNMVTSGGKMLRPAFILLAGRFGKFSAKKLYPMAAAIELLHMATLIHDDIIDNSEFRRGKKTLHEEYGPYYAVFTGDLLLTKCFSLIANHTSMTNMKLIAQVMGRICEGEIEQYSSHYRLDNTIKQYLKRIATKTAALFSLSLSIGSIESKCSKRLIKNMNNIGYNIGMAFQIIDDILDYTGSQDVVGKSLGNDLKHGIFTLPLIYALKENDKDLVDMLDKKGYSDEDIHKIINRTIELGGLEKARILAKRFTQKAFDKISQLPDCDSKSILQEVTEKLLVREY